jgi:hypothetical protein
LIFFFGYTDYDNQAMNFRYIKLFAISIFSLGIISCTALEPQFIDVDDTVLIEGSMSKDEILKILGRPVEVVRGIVMEDGEVFEIWRYSTKEGFGKTHPDNLPRKSAKNMKLEEWANSKDFFLLFKNRTLVRWGDFKFNWCNGKCSIQNNNQKENLEKIQNSNELDGKNCSNGVCINVNTCSENCIK